METLIILFCFAVFFIFVLPVLCFLYGSRKTLKILKERCGPPLKIRHYRL